ncbi:leucine-rich repeat-containing protein 40-like [Ruditapes philippinarum]|uniref:leucine-rich repeat-containing protein 40-like n=1 Tax=Ruditapes philippinarum TaxID=129788 RepID=UPI00295C36CC|nr:leucine-rich repeat-containing protein 40-like [Ruditapes philippinarum]
MAQEVARVARRLEEAKETQFLDLSKCELLKIPDAAYFMLKDSVINKCDLSGNNIKRIPSKFCTKFTDLTELQLQDNNLSSLPEEVRDMEQLQVLDISNNKFESLPVIYDSPKLNTVSAKGNKITGIDLERLRKMSSLRELDLQDNPLPEETQGMLRDIDMFTVHIGDSDPVGKELEEVE